MGPCISNCCLTIKFIILGLFNADHMAYEADRGSDIWGEPSLAEMTRKSIQILNKNNKGYFLLVEGKACLIHVY